MAGLIPRGVPSAQGTHDQQYGSAIFSAKSPDESSATSHSSYTSLSTSSMNSLSISEESLTVPPSLFIREVKIEEGEVVGSGSYGTVLKAKWYGTDVAVKKLHDIFFKALNTSELRTGILRNLARELNILVQLSHPNIVQFYGVYKPSETSLELSMDTYIVQELMCCSLDVRNLQRPRLTFRNVVDISLSVSNGLQYLHDRPDPIIHRDLATKNILLGHNGEAKIGDLGVAKVLNQDQLSVFTRQPGTELYMPPEVKIQGIAYDTKIDVYSFGVVMLEVSIGRGATAREAFEVAQCGSGMIKLVPEVERREADFKELGEHHPLRVLILECLGGRDERPSAKMINRSLMELTQSREYSDSNLIPIIAPVTPSPKVVTPMLTSPHDDSQNQQLSERNLALEDKIQSLLTDREFLQKKLDSYLREGRSEESGSSKVMTRELEQRESEVHQLMEENAMLQVALSEKESEMERLSKVSSPPSSLTDTEMRDQRALLLQRLNKLEKRDLESQEKIAALRRENELLRQELENARSQSSGGAAGSVYHSVPPDKQYSTSSSSYGQQSSQFSSTSAGTSSSPSSIETLTPSLSTLQTSSSSSRGSDTMTSSSSSATTTSQSTLPNKSMPTSAEYKKLKKQLERYKSANIELDQRLKDAKLELQRYQGQQGNTDIMYQMDVQRLSAENARLQLQLDSAVNENGRLRCDLVNRRY